MLPTLRAAEGSGHDLYYVAAGETHQRNLHTFALVTLARLQAARGVEECRSNAERALVLAAELGAGSIAVYAQSTLGLLELGAGQVEEAADRLSRLSVFVADIGLRESNVVQWRPDLIEACVLAGRGDEARAELSVLEAEASATGRVWAHATAARCRGMLADDDDLSDFDEAFRRHDELAAPFERARTQLRLGERLRRLRRPTESREQLRAARSTFELLGAAPWAGVPRRSSPRPASARAAARRKRSPV